ncbi:hypothetical protein BDW74DRAFT_54754 [Aspergillus multicolor]|uniref:ester cyclase n=1 Tax=Aspergillus multicolor TaxID=41759 RepID=UPI003CCDAB07
MIDANIEFKIPLQPLPVPTVHKIGPGITLLSPLSRRGYGPGTIVLVPDNAPSPLHLENGTPSPSLKWAEESYTVIEIRESVLKREPALDLALESLNGFEKCTPKSVVGLVAYGPTLWGKVRSLPSLTKITAAAIYASASDPPSITTPIPTIQHLSGNPTTTTEIPAQRAPDTNTDRETKQYTYPNAPSPLFALPTMSDFNYTTEAVSHTRNLSFFKKHMGGPYFDLEAIWDEHTYFEFVLRSVPHTMSTMVQEPYVNHIPTMTGGIGRENLTAFYREHFIFVNPPDAQMELVSRTVGIDRVVDESIMSMTHDREIDYLLPGIPATGAKLEIPFTAIVNIRGDRLYHEHLIWDQASVLRQVGILPEYLPFPASSGGERSGDRGKVRLPVAGADIAAKTRDKNAVASNELLGG